MSAFWCFGVTCIWLFFVINIQNASASQTRMSKWSCGVLGGGGGMQILMKCKRLSLEILYYCLKGNSLLSPQYVVVLALMCVVGKVFYFEVRPIWIWILCHLEVVRFWGSYIFFELYFLVCKMGLWYLFYRLLFILHEAYKVGEARWMFNKC